MSVFGINRYIFNGLEMKVIEPQHKNQLAIRFLIYLACKLQCKNISLGCLWYQNHRPKIKPQTIGDKKKVTRELPWVLCENSSYGFYEFPNKLERWKQNGSKEIWYLSWVSFCLRGWAKLGFIASVMSKWQLKSTNWLQNSPISSLFNNKI